MKAHRSFYVTEVVGLTEREKTGKERQLVRDRTLTGSFNYIVGNAD